jgi:aspartyl-tRNA(Asn)/glutamyl-tRNA(Gln) amidotransferase subunit C
MISKQEVQHIAELARLGITKKEEEMFQKDLSSILDFFNSLKEVDTSAIEPTFHPAKYFFKKESGKTREDKPESRTAEETNKLRNAFPQKEKGYLKVKSIL